MKKGVNILIIGNKEFDTENNTYIMGILNLTPDSFSDGGRHKSKEEALYHAEQMIKEGAHIIDIGGESTRPGYIRISEEEEIDRIVPVIQMVKNNFNIPVSVDTYKSRVAFHALEAGADMINDIWGLKADEKMAEVCVRAGCVVCLMHNRKEMRYQNFREDIVTDLKECLHLAKKAGIKRENIILDPGVGFAKTTEQNLSTINHLDDIKALSYPVLLGTSRKSVVGHTLRLPINERLSGTLATTAIGVLRGASFIRVHDILENKRVIEMTKAIISA